MFNLTAKKHYLTNSFTGYTNHYSIIVRDIIASESTLTLELKVNHTDEYLEAHEMINAIVTYNLTNDTYTIKAIGKGSRKYNYKIKNTVTMLINHLVEEANKQYKTDCSEVSFMTEKYYYNQLKEVGATTQQTNELSYNISHTFNTVQEIQAAVNVILNELQSNQTESTNNDTQTEEVAYTVANRSFETYAEAEEYCNACDFLIDMIEEVETSSISSDNQTEQPGQTKENKQMNLTYIVETKDWNNDDSYPTFYKGNNLIVAMNHFKQQHLKGEDVVLFIENEEGFTIDTITNYSGVNNIVYSKELFVPENEQLIKDHKEAVKQKEIYYDMYTDQLNENDRLKKDNERLYNQNRQLNQQLNRLNKKSNASSDQFKINDNINTLHWYEYKLRGFSLGCQPSGHIKIDNSKGRHGIIAYNRPLTENELYEYELKPYNEAV